MKVSRKVFNLVLFFLLIFLYSPVQSHAFIERSMADGLIGRLEKGHLLKLKVRAFSTEDVTRLLRNYAVPGTEIDVISFEKDHQKLYILIPYNYLKPEHQLNLIRTFFPRDKLGTKGWIHVISYFDKVEGMENLWRISLWFTGTGRNYKLIEEYNVIDHKYLYKYQEIIIPFNLLIPHFKTWRQGIIKESKPATYTNIPSTSFRDSQLKYKSDNKGSYASCSLKKGEALYTSVVIRYTGRIDRNDVLEAAEIIRKRSGIKDVTNIPVGFEIKIPLDLLSYEYLPSDDPRRKEYEEIRRETKQYLNPVQSVNLKGVYVILDSGHGGGDPGALGVTGVAEDEYVYDIMCRIKKIIEKKTSGKVTPTIIDKRQKYKIFNRNRINQDQNEVLLTTPPYRNGDSRVSVNLRCYLINYLYRKLVKSGVNPNKIVFVSLHADALHPSTWGTMIYIPGFEYTKKEFSVKGKLYNRFKEYRSYKKIRFPRHERIKSEGYSRELANFCLNTFHKNNISLHPDKPMREYVFRRRAKWLPAVIRYNPVPTKILLEVVNLKNRKDVKRLRNSDFRQNFAESFVDALVNYYNNKK